MTWHAPRRRGSPRGLVAIVALWGASGCHDFSRDVIPPDGAAPCYPDALDDPIFGDEDLTFHVGPYLGHTTTSTVSIGWESLSAGDTRVEYGPDASYGEIAVGETGTMHQVVIEDLEPATTYHYRACTDGTCTQDLWFSTAPPAGDPPRFAVWGDTQDNPDIHRALAMNIITDRPHLGLVVGDLVSDGNVREEYKERFFDPLRPFAHYQPLYAAVGNHDRKDQEVVHFRDYLMFPEDPDVPQSETSYSFVYGDAFFLVLDNTIDHLDLFFPIAEHEPPLYQWLKAQVASPAAQQARWRFAFAHYPPDATCREEGYTYGLPESAVRLHLLPLLWDYGFQAYFAGHVHCYERFDFDGHLVITTGGGGGGLEDTAECTRPLEEARAAHCVHHHVVVELGCEQAEVWARDVDGDVFERVRVFPDGTHEVVQALP